MDISLYPDISGRTVIFRHWSDIEEMDDKDILYGQDLCHQVPAIVRCRS